MKWLVTAAFMTGLMATRPLVSGVFQQPSTKTARPPAKQESSGDESGLSGPNLVYAPDPHYTVEARRAHVEGAVVLTLMVGTDGLPRDIKLIRHLGYGLDEEAIKAVRTWRFEPAKKNGRPVPIRIDTLEIEFRLH